MYGKYEETDYGDLTKNGEFIQNQNISNGY